MSAAVWELPGPVPRTQTALEGQNPTSRGRGNRGAWMLANVAMVGVLGGTGTVPPIHVRPQPLTRIWTGSRAELVFEQEPQTAEESIAAAGIAALGLPGQSVEELVRIVHSESGLTWEQLGRLMGVSRRSVHLWANGGRMSAGNEERLRNFAALVGRIPGSPEQRRAHLLSIGPSGISVAAQWRRAYEADHGVGWDEPTPPERLVGALHDRPTLKS